AIGAPALEAAEIASNGLCQRRGRCPAGANTVKPTFPIMEALLWRRAVAGPVRPRGTPMTSRHGHPVGARLRQFYAALIDERRLGARRSFFARVFSFSESLPRSATGAFLDPQTERLWSLLNEPALTFNAYHLGGPGQGSREELDEHSQRRSGPEEWRPDPYSFRRHGRRSLAPDARQPGPVGAGHRRRRTGRYRDPG